MEQPLALSATPPKYQKLNMVNLSNVLLLNVPFLFELYQIWSVESHENHQNCCHQMSDFKAKMHQIRSPPQTPLGELTALPQTP